MRTASMIAVALLALGVWLGSKLGLVGVGDGPAAGPDSEPATTEQPAGDANAELDEGAPEIVVSIVGPELQLGGESVTAAEVVDRATKSGKPVRIVRDPSSQRLPRERLEAALGEARIPFALEENRP